MQAVPFMLQDKSATCFCDLFEYNVAVSNWPEQFKPLPTGMFGNCNQMCDRYFQTALTSQSTPMVHCSILAGPFPQEGSKVLLASCQLCMYS